uniref:VINEX protein n=1 Tax=Haemonchus placei TaxID=6290 RepID=A0A158QN85_HAEPC
LLEEYSRRTSPSPMHPMAVRTATVELSLNRGDVVRIRRDVDANWLEGERNGQSGLFPRSYVQVGTRFIISTKAIYPFTARRATELSLKMGELVTLRREIDENWLEGTNHLGEIGIFPRTVVLTKVSIFQSVQNEPLAYSFYSSKAVQITSHFSYRALYPYSPMKDDEVALEVNDIIFVVEKCDDGWYIGTVLRTGQFGTFPGNYVERH